VGYSSQWCRLIEEEADAGVAVVDAVRPASRKKQSPPSPHLPPVHHQYLASSPTTTTAVSQAGEVPHLNQREQAMASQEGRQGCSNCCHPASAQAEVVEDGEKAMLVVEKPPRVKTESWEHCIDER
jgi:hypothetical protein